MSGSLVAGNVAGCFAAAPAMIKTLNSLFMSGKQRVIEHGCVALKTEQHSVRLQGLRMLCQKHKLHVLGIAFSR